jgi:hypothetical protein
VSLPSRVISDFCSPWCIAWRHNTAHSAATRGMAPPLAACPEAMRGMSELRPLFTGGGRRRKKTLLCHGYSQALPNVEKESRSCARGQVITARHKATGAETRRALSALSREQGALCCVHRRNMRGNPFGPSEKAISRGDRLCRRSFPPPRQGRKAGRRLPVVSWVMRRARILGNSGLSVGCGVSWLLRVVDHELEAALA